MINFPITTVANCFDNPDEIVRYANTLKYYKSPIGNYPSVRTKSLHESNQKFFDKFITSVLSLYYDFRYHNITWDNTYVAFHKMKPFSNNKSDIRNKGWIHKDNCILAGVVYLNKKTNPNCGTSFYKPITDINNQSSIKQKTQLYKKNVFNKKLYENEYKNHSKKFIKIQTANNVYNNLVVYDGNIWHSFDNMLIDKNTERLNLVFFIYNLKIDNLPLIKYNKHRI